MGIRPKRQASKVYTVLFSFGIVKTIFSDGTYSPAAALHRYNFEEYFTAQVRGPGQMPPALPALNGGPVRGHQNGLTRYYRRSAQTQNDSK